MAESDLSAADSTPLTECLVGLGANRGERESTLAHAVEKIEQLACNSTFKVSSWLTSSAIGGPPNQGDFLNGAIYFFSSLAPEKLLAELNNIEAQHRRTRRERWAARTLDADLLLYGEQVINTDGLQIPHPRMSFRPFVMTPAVQIAPHMKHPQLQATLLEINHRVQSDANAVAIMGGEAVDREWVRKKIVARAPVYNATDQVASNAKLQVVLDTSMQILPGCPTLWLPPEQRQLWSQEIAAALDCLWSEANIPD